MTIFTIEEDSPDGGVEEDLERREGGDPGRVLERFLNDPDETEILNLGVRCWSLEERTDARIVGVVAVRMNVGGVGMTVGF